MLAALKFLIKILLLLLAGLVLIWCRLFFLCFFSFLWDPDQDLL